MNHPQITTAPLMKTGMLIRRPVEDVFEAFIDPEVTTRFWFTRSSGRLEQGGCVQWDWEMYGISVPVTVEAIEPNERILIEWGEPGARTTVEWTFRPCGGGTFVDITHSGFAGTGDELVKMATDSTQGFTLVLAGLKALLEHDVELNVVADRFPAGLESH
jgi:uncharacterized protein YndB with AHSA1/START domain